MIEFFFNMFFFFSQMPFHNFSISFSFSSCSCSSSLFRKIHSHTKYSWSHMFDSCQLYLKLCFSTIGIFFKYFQYQVYSIPSLCSNTSELVIYLIYLLRFEYISKNKDICSLSFHFFYYIIESPLSYKSIIIRRCFVLNMFEYYHSSIGIYKIFKLYHSILHCFFGCFSW